MIVPLTNEDEAHYLAGLLNSSLIRLLVGSYTIETAMDTHILDHLKILKYDESNPLHSRISELSKDAHQGRGSLRAIELDEKVGHLYGLSNKEMDDVRLSLGLITIVSKEPEDAIADNEDQEPKSSIMRFSEISRMEL